MTSLRQTMLRDAVFRLKATPQYAGASRHLSKSARCRDASQPAPSAAAQNPQAARVVAANASNANSGGDARSRLAKLQAQRLEELNRGRSGSGRARRPNKPEQKWSNRTLIALATSVGACTYLMGTYHGYNAGKAHAEQEQVEASGLTPLEAASAVTASHPNVDGSNGIGRNAQAQASIPLLGALPDALAQLLPMSWAGNTVQCEPQHDSSTQRNCRLAELTQYHCDFHANRVVCQPIDRIFRICKGRPAVEVSHIVEFDEDGKPYLPPHLSEAMPPSSHWHELRSPDL
ncbi:related to putative protein [Ustilago trichophora]|uniref:Uncharacterized protein n=1 Tax=Ustilago trichophora TaxID=86804 RepID=A0A5C3E314_9BASI|nr:related to putative protein [Ustilago trichophora]